MDIGVGTFPLTEALVYMSRILVQPTKSESGSEFTAYTAKVEYNLLAVIAVIAHRISSA